MKASYPNMTKPPFSEICENLSLNIINCLVDKTQEMTYQQLDGKTSNKNV